MQGFLLGSTEAMLTLADQILRYVLYGTIVLGVIFFLVLLVFAIKGLRYHHQMKQNKKEKEKLIKAYDQKIEQLRKQEQKQA